MWTLQESVDDDEDGERKETGVAGIISQVGNPLTILAWFVQPTFNQILIQFISLRCKGSSPQRWLHIEPSPVFQFERPASSMNIHIQLAGQGLSERDWRSKYSAAMIGDQFPPLLSPLLCIDISRCGLCPALLHCP